MEKSACLSLLKFCFSEKSGFSARYTLVEKGTFQKGKRAPTKGSAKKGHY
jgi:hypothetical protein